MEPVRTCLGCRTRASASSLVRCVARSGAVVVDVSASLAGRGAWLHPTVECVENTLKRRAFGRALRVTEALDTSQVLPAVLALHQSEPSNVAP
jgi:predicted RNA-binding protein YlxR (DUF448 family)